MISDSDRAAIDQWIAMQKWDETTAVFVAGLDVPILEYLAEQVTCSVVVFETRFSRLKNTSDPLERIGAKLCASPADLRRELVLRYQNRQRVIHLECDPSDELRQLFLDTEKDARERTAISHGTGSRHAATWLDRIISTVPMLDRYTPISRVGAPLAGIPAVIVGAGPSLDRNIDELKRFKGRAFICAVNSSVGPLLKAGIVPDAVCVAEAQDQSSQLRDLPQAYRRRLIAGTHVHPAVHALDWDERIIAVHDAGPQSKWLADAIDEPLLSMGGSVTTLAFVSLCTMGCKHIILAGQDCALTEGRDHAAGWNFQEKIKPRATRQVTAWGGDGVVDTTSVYITFKWWYEEAASALAGHVRLTNATEGGARIDGWEEQRLTDISPGLERDIDSTVSEAIRAAAPIDMQRVLTALRYERKAAHSAARSIRAAHRAAKNFAAEDSRFRHLFERTRLLLGASQTDIYNIETSDPLERTFAVYEAVRGMATGGLTDSINEAIKAIEA